MEGVLYLVDFVMHLDKHLSQMIQDFGVWTYVILFAIIFLETGVVVTPFLPGDSFLFTAGILSSQGYLNIVLLIFLSFAGAVLGDSFGYVCRRKVGPRIFTREDSLLFHKKHLERAAIFYENLTFLNK